MKKQLVAAILLGIGSGAASGAHAHGGAARFVSPDGTRAVELYLEKRPTGSSFSSHEGTPALRRLFDEAARRDPFEMNVLFTKTDPPRGDIHIRFFAPGYKGDPTARYRVLWSKDSRRFVVLSTRAKLPRGSSPGWEAPKWNDSEFAVFGHDRLTEANSTYRPQLVSDWPRTDFPEAVAGAPLPVLKDPHRTGPQNLMRALDRIGEMGTSLKHWQDERLIYNFTTHPNEASTDVLPPIATSVTAPDGRKTAELRRQNTWLMVVLSEGDVFRDQKWMLLGHVRDTGGVTVLNPAQTSRNRFVWSADSRYVLLLTQGVDSAELEVLNGEQLYLLFDTEDWAGLLGPRSTDLRRIAFPVPLQIPDAGQRK